MKSITGMAGVLIVFVSMALSGCSGMSSWLEARLERTPEVETVEPVEAAAVVDVPEVIEPVPEVKPISALDGDAYLFVHFTGESPMGEQIYFSVSTNGLDWTDLNNGRPVLISDLGEKGVRDPAIIRAEDGTFYILATDLRIASGQGWDHARFQGSHSLIFWKSDDLIHWSEPWSVEVSGAIPGAGCTWAPEAIYDDTTGEYVVYWATIATKDGVKEARIYAAKTMDFRTFTPAELYIERTGDGVDGGDIIDTQIIKVEDGQNQYYRVSRDTQITLEAADSIFGEWTRIGDLSDLGYTARDVEGPILFQFNNEQKWCLLVDRYATSGGYIPIVTTNLCDSFEMEVVRDRDYSMGASLKRHGSVLNISQAEYDAVVRAWENAPVCRIESVRKSGHFLRTDNGIGRIEANVIPKEDALWRMVPGLVEGYNMVSLQSVSSPDHYLALKEDSTRLLPNDESASFAERATFKKVKGLAGPTSFLLQLLNDEEMYLTDWDSVLVTVPVSTGDEKMSATFRMVQ